MNNSSLPVMFYFLIMETYRYTEKGICLQLIFIIYCREINFII